jgi:hypothetical protein
MDTARITTGGGGLFTSIWSKCLTEKGIYFLGYAFG